LGKYKRETLPQPMIPTRIFFLDGLSSATPAVAFQVPKAKAPTAVPLVCMNFRRSKLEFILISLVAGVF